MENLRVGVLIKDVEYRNALIRGLSHESRDISFIVPGSDGVISGMDMLLTDRDCSETTIPVIRVTRRDNYDTELSDSNEIFMYEDASVFVNKILFYYQRATGHSLFYSSSRKTGIIAFVSPKGGSGTTSLALSLAGTMFKRYGKKSLYVSLCPIDGSTNYFSSIDKGNVLSLIYHLSRGEDVPIGKYISSYGGVDRIRTRSLNRAASEMVPEELDRLVKLIESARKYDFVIFDIGDHLTSGGKHIADVADLIVVVGSDGRGADHDIMCSLTESSDKDVIKVALMRTDSSDNEANDIGTVMLSYEPSSFVQGEERVSIDLRGKYGEDVGKLAKDMVGRLEEDRC